MKKILLSLIVLASVQSYAMGGNEAQMMEKADGSYQVHSIDAEKKVLSDLISDATRPLKDCGQKERLRSIWRILKAFNAPIVFYRSEETFIADYNTDQQRNCAENISQISHLLND